jgi:hypothetical protein
LIGSKVGDNIEVPFCTRVITHDMALPMVGTTRVLSRGRLTLQIRIAPAQAAIPHRPETKQKSV